MTEFINISEVDELEKVRSDAPLYVMIAGGMAAGKTHIVNENIKAISIFDIDDVMRGLSFVEYTRDEFAKAMRHISKMIDDYMKLEESMVAMGTASNTTVAINRLYAAKMKGYDTVLVHIDTPVSQAIEQNFYRIKNGERGVSQSDEHKIETTTSGAVQTVAVLRESALVDYFVYYNNTRKIIDE